MSRLSTSARLWWALFAIALLAINLRPGATSLGPVLAEVKQGLGINGTVAGVLTALPGLAFAVFGAVAVSIGLRMGLTGALAAAGIVSTVGLLARPFVDSALPFLLLSVLAFAGMAVGNVLVPAYIKETFPNRLAGVMSVYTISLAIGATGSSMLSAPLSGIAPGGWRFALGIWGVAMALATIPWIVLAVSDRRRRVPADPDAPRLSGSIFAVVRSRKAIALAVFFGTQSMQAYVQFGWLAQMFRDGGLGATEAGWLVGLTAALGVPAGFVMPVIAARVRDPRWVVVVLGALLVAGYLGVWLAPATLPWLWATLLGVSSFAFALSLALVTARTRDPHVTTQLSGFTQSVGYLFSAGGPLVVGVLFDLTHGWTVPLWFLLASAGLFTLSGVAAARPGYVDDDLVRA
ncbi:MAG TPA: MFS transporter [Propioniciclava sp.]|uniref:MFS transporter n=1 Tax=Propioniciclava sp. TaxID=2038686 RepID=UPI002BB4EB39|nr:MFS transporter [Propioniciclava sp.]HRL49600.1 MFS transporter [Propioniciclava sp.]